MGAREHLNPEQHKHYMAGWKSGQTPSYKKVENADMRRAHGHWYLGYFDAEGGREKYESVEPPPDE